MKNNENETLELELFAEELPEQMDMSTSPHASFSSTSSLSTATCPGSSLASAGTVSTVG